MLTWEKKLIMLRMESRQLVDYLRVFLRMSLFFLGDVLKEGLKGTAEASK